MSESNVSRPVRRVAVPEHLWETFEQMALEMGTERDGLINQAMFMFARLNGFLTPGQPQAAAGAVAAKAESRPVERAQAIAAAPLPDPEPEPEAEEAEPEFEASEAAAYDDAPAYDEASAFDDAPAFEEAAGIEDAPAFDDAPAFEEEPAFDDRTPLPAPSPLPAPRRPAAAASGLPRLSRGGPAPAPVDPPVVKPRPEPEIDSRRRMTELASPAQEVFASSSSSLDNDPARKAVAERVLETAAELERLIKGKQQAAAEPLPPPTDSTGITGAPMSEGAKSLYMMGDDGELEKISKDRFLIGRGKHCDLIINSGKVSREHAVITHEGDDFFVEDLGSSNGTWFNKQRIKRRKIEDGDEYFICSDRVKCVVR